MYNATLRRVRVTIVDMEKQSILNIMSVYLYYRISGPCCIVICGLSGCTVFSHIFSQMTQFSGKSYEIENLFGFLFLKQLSF